MWTQMRIAPSSSRSAEIASSKSRAVGGSIVKVGRAAQVAARAVVAVRRVLGGLARRPLDGGVEAPPQPAVEHQRLDHVARDVRPPEPPHDLAVPPRGLGRTSTRSPARTSRGRLSSVDPAAAREERRRR